MQKLEFANTLRGLAALSVLISHYFGVFWLAREAAASFAHANVLSPSHYPTPFFITPIHSSPYLNFGAFGVALFFLISGFVIPFSITKLSRKNFLINRLFRIYPTYILGFSVTLAAIFIADKYFGKSFGFSFRQVFIHFLPGIHDITKANIDGIIWTLDIEIKFYAVCVLCASLFKRGTINVFWVPFLLGISAWIINAYLHHTKFVTVFVFTSPYIVFMFIGVVFHFLYQRRLKSEEAILITSGCFMLFAIITSALPLSPFTQTWSYGVALFIFALAYTYPSYFKGNTIVNFLADISYPLYVVHGLSGYVMLFILLDNGFSATFSLLLTTTFALSLAFLFHKLIERPSQRLGKRLSEIKPLPYDLQPSTVPAK